MKSFQDEVAVSTEEEATTVTSYFLREKYGIRVELKTIYLDSNVEVDLYGVTGDVCVFGEAAIRVGPSKVKDLLNKFDYAKKRFPEKLGDKVILVLYGLRILPGVIEEAEKHGIWVVTASGEKN